MPVPERTCWAMKPARSILARVLLSKIENKQMPTKPIVIENSPGEVYGNSAEPQADSGPPQAPISDH